MRDSVDDYEPDDFFFCGCVSCYRDEEDLYRWASRATKSSLQKTAAWQTLPWQWYGLTQACRQFREEYRPFWIRDLRVRLSSNTFSPFVDTFLPTGALGTLAPEDIQISWPRDHHKSSATQSCLAPLLQFKVRFPTVRFEFVPLEVADRRLMPDDVLCDSCQEAADSMPDYLDPIHYLED